MVDEPTPATTSAAYDRMAPAWQMVDDILAGPATVRSKGELYLPKYSAEGQDEYKRRLKQAPWQPEFADILLTLSSKPFGREVSLDEGASETIKALAEDIDGKGNNLTAFARPMFRKGIAKGMAAILVDNTGKGTARTVAEERVAGVRPYWVLIRPEDVLALYTATVKGREIPIHVRLRESTVEREGDFGERQIERVRVINRAPLTTTPGMAQDYGPPTWKLYEKVVDKAGKVTWIDAGEGQFAPLTEIPLALFWTGEREGSQFARPPLDALADKQIELYRALARQDEILTYAGSPMLCGTGIQPPKAGETMQVGPKRVLFAPPGVEGKATGWEYVQPNAANLTEIRESVKALVDDIRRLGMQPLTQRSGGVSATASSIEGAKAHSAVQAWALGLKDTLEQAFVFTAQWLREPDNVEVEVDTDFSVEPYSQPALQELREARKAREISRPAYLDGLKRFGVLQPDFDAEDDEAILAEEMQGLEPDDADPMDPAIDPANDPQDPADEA
jgi:hypothetical protein